VVDLLRCHLTLNIPFFLPPGAVEVHLQDRFQSDRFTKSRRLLPNLDWPSTVNCSIVDRLPGSLFYEYSFYCNCKCTLSLFYTSYTLDVMQILLQLKDFCNNDVQ